MSVHLQPLRMIHTCSSEGSAFMPVVIEQVKASVSSRLCLNIKFTVMFVRLCIKGMTNDNLTKFRIDIFIGTFNGEEKPNHFFIRADII